MKADQAKQLLETSIDHACRSLNKLTIERAVTLILEFYRYQRVEDCELENDGDMLLFQWGTYDWGDGRFFEFDLTRQFVIGEGGEDEDIWQLSLKFEFLPNDNLHDIGTGNRWCHANTPASMDAFECFIRDSAAYKTILLSKPENIKLDYFNAG